MATDTDDPDFFSPQETRRRMDACLKKMLTQHLSPEEHEIVADVARRNGWRK